MKFTKQIITEKDLQLNPKRKNLVKVGNKWVLNKNKDTFLYFIRGDRQDMEGTIYEWWLFCYEGHYLILRLEHLSLIEADDTDYLKLWLSDISITSYDSYKKKVVQLNDLNIDHIDFFKVLNEAFSIYKSYGYRRGGFHKKYNTQVEVLYEGNQS